MMIFIATFVGSLIGMRLAYDCWPWEASKTWHCTKGEIEFLRAAQEVPCEED